MLLASSASSAEDNAAARSLATRDLGSYTVASGDTLYSIARRSNLSIDDLRTLNQLDGNLVQVGQKLKLKADGAADNLVASNGGDGADPALVKVSETRPAASHARRSKEYVVQRGDTLFSIARRFGVTHNDIQRINGSRHPSHLQPGQKVKIVGL
ncbi:Membrane-bound lytic murein transglycosylase D precursor [Chromobacterium violaceum]|uniref:Membrane-bound lytic murein transglycosylase D n=1 Tax=Chromobacterium violaceum TaxID=536 RepID=A0A447T8U0_CHRVL|nr:Membrane-bound lytic murein transglycosylase D precursor [Chromobacterium violaceum]